MRLQCAIEPMPQLLPLPLSRVWHRARVTLRSRQELPLPFGVRVEVRHKALGVLVAAATAGEEEAREYERQMTAAHGASLQASAAQADQALAKLADFMRGKEIYFAGAGDIEAGTVERPGGAPLAWAIEYPGRPAYQAQNEATLDGIAAILHEFEAVMLEVRTPNPSLNPNPNPNPRALSLTLSLTPTLTRCAARPVRPSAPRSCSRRTSGSTRSATCSA